MVKDGSVRTLAITVLNANQSLNESFSDLLSWAFGGSQEGRAWVGRQAVT